MVKYFRVSIMVCLIAAIAAASAFSQAAGPESQTPKDQAVQAAPPAKPESKEIAVYGEIQAVNAALGTLSVQYYDYDSDSEKTSEVVVGAATKMENAKALGDIKKGDWVDVTYIVSEGKNMAKMVSVEKEEPATEPAGGDAAADSPSEY
jgi:hypothetical protein